MSELPQDFDIDGIVFNVIQRFPYAGEGNPVQLLQRYREMVKAGAAYEAGKRDASAEGQPGESEAMLEGALKDMHWMWDELDRRGTHETIMRGCSRSLSVIEAALAKQAPKPEPAVEPLNGLDTPERVRFYEHDFYPLSNFSAFTLEWRGLRFATSEAAYHWEKFPDLPNVQAGILNAPSAHEAFKLAEAGRKLRRHDWDAVKVDIMRGILRAKVAQHDYVRRKLLATGDRELVEDSWRDDFWGWGPKCDGQNMLGKLWMELRAELTVQPEPKESP